MCSHGESSEGNGTAPHQEVVSVAARQNGGELGPPARQDQSFMSKSEMSGRGLGHLTFAVIVSGSN